MRVYECVDRCVGVYASTRVGMRVRVYAYRRGVYISVDRCVVFDVSMCVCVCVRVHVYVCMCVFVYMCIGAGL